MVKLKVVVDFKDKETLVKHYVGEVIERTETRANELLQRKVCVAVEEPKKIEVFESTSIEEYFNKTTKSKPKKAK